MGVMDQGGAVALMLEKRELCAATR